MFPNPNIGINVQYHPHTAKAFTLKEQVKAKAEHIYSEHIYSVKN